VGKLIILLLLVAVAWALFKHLAKPRAGLGNKSAAPPEDMVRCARCGVHLPRSESLVSRGEFFCSEEHLRLQR